MSYLPTTWKTGDIITAEKLNHIEDGIYINDTLIVNAEGVNMIPNPTIPLDTTIDKTPQEIFDAIDQGRNVVICFSSGGGPEGRTLEIIQLSSYIAEWNENKSYSAKFESFKYATSSLYLITIVISNDGIYSYTIAI